ncbi:hypothetical protein [Streptomyces sp. NBC_00162]|uniref:hypothetical protein n=1 Tax=Streptomyces sp. NBC_00162 TaxID=2903629 RepID=UPI00214C5DB9|nr:hypothetical protein [Streptomyces sp. NBC_00162]UUU37898.1 hypothetical protein JIW86_02810 [Streptomyces sp. NBC_00162]
MSKREPRRRRPPTPPSQGGPDEAVGRRLGDTATGDGGAGGHAAKRQQTGKGREEQVRPHPARAAEER